MSTLVDELRSGRTICALSIGSGSPAAVELAGDSGFSALVLDARNAAVSPFSHQLEGLVRAARAAGIPAIASVPESSDGTVNRALNDGVDGVIVPRINSAEEARELVDATRYPPVGRRGAAPVVRAANYGLRDWDDYRDESNYGRLVLASIESPAGLDAAAAIFEVDGLDGVVLDLLTLSLHLGSGSSSPTDMPEVADLVGSEARRSKVRGVLLAEHSLGVAWARAGANLVILDNELAACAEAMQSARKSLQASAGIER